MSNVAHSHQNLPGVDLRLKLYTHLMPHMAADTTLRVPVILCSARVRNPSS